MAWFKIDDGFYDNPKVKAIPRSVRMECLGLWVTAGTWASKHLTDGAIPGFMVDEFGADMSHGDTLVDVGLWRRTDDGFAFHDWLEYQPSRASTLAFREKERQRKEAYRAKKAGNTGQSPDGTSSDGGGTVPDVSGLPDPTRPDPTRPTNKKNSSRIDDAFARAYDAWPKKVEKKKSLDKFRLLTKKHDPDWLAEQIIRFGKSYSNTTEKRFVPALNVWLNGERWTDELPTPSTEVINAQWEAAMRDVRPDPCAGGHKWASDGSCVRCLVMRGSA